MSTVAIEYGAADRRSEVDKYEFMSTGWNTAAQSLAGEYKDRIAAPGKAGQVTPFSGASKFGIKFERSTSSTIVRAQLDSVATSAMRRFLKL